MPYNEKAAYLHAAPMFHIGFPAPVRGSGFGIRQVTIPKFSPQNFCETVQRERVTGTVLVPTMINHCSSTLNSKNYDLTSLERMGYGGSPMAPEIIQRTRELLPHLKLVQAYGLSETGFLTGLLDQEHKERPTSCGRPCPGIDVRVVDESGKEVAVGQRGELVARGANVTRGYWGHSDETKSAFQDGLFRTGDVGYQVRGYFYILDRLKDMIVRAAKTFIAVRSKRSFTNIRRFVRRRSSASPIRNGASSSRPAFCGSRDTLLARTT